MKVCCSDHKWTCGFNLSFIRGKEIFLKTFVIGILALLSPALAYAEKPESVEEDVNNEDVSGKSYGDDIWKYNKKIMVGYTTGKLDRKVRFGGKISSRWGASLISGTNIYFHKKPIGGFLRFGLNLDANVNYMNFEKGSGSFSDIWNPGDEGSSQTSLGQHYVTCGIAVGPTATFAPFFASGNRRLAQLKFRPFFHVVPSYAAYVISNDEDTEMHGAFAFWCAAGLEIQWKRLLIGVEWKGCTAKYKGFVDSIIADNTEGYEAQGSHKFDTNMINLAIGFAF